MNRLLKSVAVLLTLTGCLLVSTVAASANPLNVQTLSSRANWVTGGDALVAVDTASSVKRRKS